MFKGVHFIFVVISESEYRKNETGEISVATLSDELLRYGASVGDEVEIRYGPALLGSAKIKNIENYNPS